MANQGRGPVPGIGEVLGEAGGCPEVIDSVGRRWKIGHPTQAAKRVLEGLVAAAALAEIKAQERYLSPSDYSEELAAHRRAVLAKEFRTFGSGWERIMSDPPTAGTLFLLSLLRTHHPHATEADARSLQDDCPLDLELALDEVIPSFFPVLVMDDRIPKANRAEVLARLQAWWAERKAKASAEAGEAVPAIDATPPTRPTT